MTWNVNQDWTVLSQVMLGRTRMGPITQVDVPFASAYVLIGHRWLTDHGTWRLAGRGEFFMTDDRDNTLDDPNATEGYAATIAGSWQPSSFITILSEAMLVNHSKDTWTSTNVEANESTEYVLQIAFVGQF